MIKYITYKEHKYPIRVSYRALSMFESETGIKFDDLADGKGELKYYETLLYHSLVAGEIAEKDNEKLVFKHGDKKEITKKDMLNVLDECWLEFLGHFSAFFPDTEKGADEGNAPKKGNRQQMRSGGKKLVKS